MRAATEPGLYGCGRLADFEGAPLRPGGLALTEELIALAGFRPGDRVADVGCGLGASTRLLDERGVRAVGVDEDVEGRKAGGAWALIAADAARLPFADACLDGVLAECVLSVLPDRAAALAEWARLLKAGGSLAVSDVYARAGDGTARIGTRESLTGAVAAAGLRVERFEDRSEALKRFVAEFIFGYGSLAALCGGRGGIDAAALRAARPGYCLIVALKDAPPWLTNLSASQNSCSGATPAATSSRSSRSKRSAGTIPTSSAQCRGSPSAWAAASTADASPADAACSASTAAAPTTANRFIPAST